ncbi:Uncharacterized protein conserved in bacteria [Aeromonas encheleia]|jgi:uncharacterized protein YejL (UPF0352 family)|uniref:DUF1414 domain-containing protein n=1 Tax=Aeromonas TaxID=642 RepID=UPI0005B1E6A0|nr:MULTISPECIES: YejL family protein [Aeromonas]MBV7413371.1 YejL family protein [Aeromonas sp. sif2433]MBV7436111.1 YejL family protein [Aeromonas sp. sif2416]MBV7596783.1 YejL family protein [Aeromonas sp. sia0103]UNP87356.1 YejL family protein [Aeromonas encheleia]VEG95970.1 Uncharacterized protein conserved in bacteria [Aeromonas encheleia]
MPIVSKYTNQQFDDLMNDLITVLEKHKAPVDLSLMVLGNLSTNIINNMAPAQRQAIAEKFIQALTSSVDNRHDAH